MCVHADAPPGFCISRLVSTFFASVRFERLSLMLCEIPLCETNFFMEEEEKPAFPFEVFVRIVDFLPDSVVYALWCSGRELHSLRELYNERILPFGRVAQWHKLCIWRRELLTKNAQIAVSIKDGAFLESMSPFIMRLDAPDNASSAKTFHGKLKRARVVYSLMPLFDFHLHLRHFADVMFDFDRVDEPIRMVLYYNDSIERYEELVISRIVYWRWTNRIEITGTKGYAGHLNTNVFQLLGAARGLLDDEN